MADTFLEQQPVLNSPYEVPTHHHDLNKNRSSIARPVVLGRRRSELITPTPASTRAAVRELRRELDAPDLVLHRMRTTRNKAAHLAKPGADVADHPSRTVGRQDGEA